MSEPSYKSGLVKKQNIHPWLKYLENSLLYRFLKIKINWNRLVHFDDDEAPCKDDEIELTGEVTGIKDLAQMATALNTIGHSIICDDAAAAIGQVSAACDICTEGEAAGLAEGTHSLDIAPVNCRNQSETQKVQVRVHVSYRIYKPSS